MQPFQPQPRTRREARLAEADPQSARGSQNERQDRASRGRRRGRGWRWTAGILTVVALLGGYGYADVVDAVPGVLTAQPPRPDPVPFPTPTLRVTTTEGATPVGDAAPTPAAESVNDLVEEALADGLPASTGIDIRDALTGDVLYARDAGASRTPASTTKVLTAAAALAEAGAETRLPTTAYLHVPENEADPPLVILHGGGDVLLGAGESDSDAVDGHAGLASLAQETAHALRGHGIDEVAVARDESLFSGADFHPTWDRADIGHGFVAPLSPLMIAAGRTGEGMPRSDRPGEDAARAFAEALQDAGIEVRGHDGSAQAADADDELAQVLSAPLRAQAEHLLVTSDNVVSEAVGRQVALARGEEADFAGAARAVEDAMADLGLEDEDGAISLTDLSGLSYDNRIPPEALSRLLVLAVAGEGPLAELPSLMPVGGWSGTLSSRYRSEESADGAGIVRAKTGSLRSVTSLAGTLVTADGRLLAFAVMGDGLEPAEVSRARPAMDALLAGLARCGC